MKSAKERKAILAARKAAKREESPWAASVLSSSVRGPPSEFDRMRLEEVRKAAAAAEAAAAAAIPTSPAENGTYFTAEDASRLEELREAIKAEAAETAAREPTAAVAIPTSPAETATYFTAEDAARLEELRQAEAARAAAITETAPETGESSTVVRSERWEEIRKAQPSGETRDLQAEAIALFDEVSRNKSAEAKEQAPKQPAGVEWNLLLETAHLDEEMMREKEAEELARSRLDQDEKVREEVRRWLQKEEEYRMVREAAFKPIVLESDRAKLAKAARLEELRKAEAARAAAITATLEQNEKVRKKEAEELARSLLKKETIRMKRLADRKERKRLAELKEGVRIAELDRLAAVAMFEERERKEGVRLAEADRLATVELFKEREKTEDFAKAMATPTSTPEDASDIGAKDYAVPTAMRMSTVKWRPLRWSSIPMWPRPRCTTR